MNASLEGNLADYSTCFFACFHVFPPWKAGKGWCWLASEVKIDL